eukprot:6202945-Pleurochrysis_carterae.AAC.1
MEGETLSHARSPPLASTLTHVHVDQQAGSLVHVRERVLKHMHEHEVTLRSMVVRDSANAISTREGRRRMGGLDLCSDTGMRKKTGYRNQKRLKKRIELARATAPER